ncbi:MAG: iron chaperone [Flavisolibacter sp.]
MLKPANIDQYIAAFPKETQQLLQQVRTTIKKAAPKAEEVISYGMPGFKLNGMLVWFAGYKNHIGFYPKPSAIEAFKKELSVYKYAKGSIQFPLDKPLPLALIAKMVKLRVAENMQKAELKKA